ncbi:MAG TPA: hypothetical protein PK733_16020 [Clostridiales bacterium]|nr:hypothetical protein [Clostridiales bacterium]
MLTRKEYIFPMLSKIIPEDIAFQISYSSIVLSSLSYHISEVNSNPTSRAHSLSMIQNMALYDFPSINLSKA